MYIQFVCTNICVDAYMHTCIRVYIYIYVCMCIYIFLYMYICLLLLYTIPKVFQLYHGVWWYDVWDEKEKARTSTLTTQGIFNLPHHIGMRGTGLRWHCRDTQLGNGLRTVKCYGCGRDSYLHPQVTYPMV